MRLLLLAPAEPGAGASLYNGRMVETLQALGHAAELVPLHGAYPAVRPDPGDAALCARLPGDACLVLDGIAFAVHAALPRPPVGLIHHPSALQGEAGGADPARLRAAELAALAQMPRLIATSGAVADRLVAQYGRAAAQVTAVLPGVEVLPRREPQTAWPCHVLSLGPMVKRRGQDVLLRALARLFDLDWRLTLAGSQHRDPAYVAALRGLIAEHGLGSQVTLQDEQAPMPWDTTDILALANPVPGTTGLSMQALRRGIPLVCGAAEVELWPPQAGAFCSPGDEETFSKALRRMIFDPALRGQMARAAWHAGLALPSWRTQAERFLQACTGDSATPYRQPMV